MEQDTYFKAQKLIEVIDNYDVEVAELKEFLQYAGDTVQLTLNGGGYNTRCDFKKSALAGFINGLVADLERAADKARADLAAL